MRSTVLFLSVALTGLAAQAAGQKLPADFTHNRIHLVAHAGDGAPLTAYVDSGGGSDLILPASQARLQLPATGEITEDGQTFALVDFPAWLAKDGIPAPPDGAPAHGKLTVFPPEPGIVDDYDVFLGAPWLDGRVWLIDYGRHEMILAPDWKPGAGDRALPLGFQVDAHGTHTTSMPRMAVTIDGKSLQMLLDTGAMITLKADGASTFHVAPGTIVGGGFIMASVFDEWHSKHPDWRFVAHGEAALSRDGNAMIEVPQVTVAGFTVGPVWFARRPDGNFATWMSSMMDKPIVGAFGGSGLQYFRLVLDYLKATAWLTPTTTSN
jgi:hypothetical protein